VPQYREKPSLFFLAKKSGCAVRELADSLVLIGRPVALMRFVCRCFIADISFVSYVLRPAKTLGFFRLQVCA